MESLPLEILYEILIRLPPTTFLRMRHLNRFFRDLYEDEFLWQQACQYISDVPSVSYWKPRYYDDDVYWKGRVLELHPSSPGPADAGASCGELCDRPAPKGPKGDYPETTWKEIFHHIRDGHLGLIPIILQDKIISSLWISSSSNINGVISRICNTVFAHYPELSEDIFKLTFKHLHRSPQGPRGRRDFDIKRSIIDTLVIIHNGRPFESLHPTDTIVYHLDSIEVVLYDWQPMAEQSRHDSQIDT